MNTKTFMSTIAVAFVISFTSALAVPSPLNITLSGSPPFTGSSAVVANNDSPTSFGDDTVFDWLTDDVARWNTINSTSLPAPTRNADKTPLFKMETPSGPDSVSLTLGAYDYLFLHWGGKKGGWAQAYYIGNITGGDFVFDAPPGGHPDVGGLSFYSFYGPTPKPSTTHPTPDGGATLALLGMAVAGLGMLRRRINA